MTDNEKAMGCALILIGGSVSTVVGVIMRGWVLTILWSWFITPLFSLKEIGIVNAIGLSIVAAYLTKQTTHCEDKRESHEKIIEMLLSPFLSPLFALAIAWVVHSFA